MKRFLLAALTLAAVHGDVVPVKRLQADEGMWLVNDPPRKLLKKKYDFELTPGWLERAQKASVRFNNGGSGSFVSADGLLVTNHHIGAELLQKLSPRGKDYRKDGYHATSRAKELKCPDLELNVLMEIEDVTERVNDAVKAGSKPAEAAAARKAAMAKIEKESLDRTGMRSDVVTLFQGGLYHLYRYKKYTDIRLVLAPDDSIANFGGDVDNFEYPRHSLDVCFFRAYEDDKPVKPTHYFRWATRGPKEDDLVFVTGHPGTTNRLETVARLLHRRDHSHPATLQRLRALEALLHQFSQRGPEQAKMAASDFHRVANARKAFTGQYQGLLDPSVLARKEKEEKALRDQFARTATRAERDPWGQIEAAQKKLREFERLYDQLETGQAFYTQLFVIARGVARLTAEREKPDGERLREYRESNLESLTFQLYSPAPIHAELERDKLAGSLSLLAENLGGGHPLVVKVLAGQTPAVRAAELVGGTRLFDPAVRRKLVEGGVKAVRDADDSMIKLALLVDDEARRLRQRMETEIEEVERQAYARIARVRFELYGRDVAPDATFTLRLAFGTVKGYQVDGETLPFHTNFASLFEKARAQGGVEPFGLSQAWQDSKEKLDLRTPLNFVSTADTIGGNSGSPVLNRDGELVGINFDRNRHGLVRNFVYTDEQARHISVHGLAVLEALRKVHGAKAILKELGVSE